MNGKSKTPNPVDDTQLKALQAQVQTLETEKKTLEETNKALTTEIQGLTEQIEVLEEKNDEAEAKIYELDCLLIELSNASEYLESGSVDANAQVEMLLQKISTYETLIKAQSKFIQVDDEAMEAALNALESQLHHLSDEALNAYYMILEYMEQPYRGN
jgi:predicted  nucleic acid-binding Zn-ribbon protein